MDAVAEPLSPAAPRSPGGPVAGLGALRLFVLLLALVLLTRFFMIVPAGERGVLLRFGAVQEQVLQEGLHLLLPLRDAFELMNVRVQTRSLRSEAASSDLQDVAIDLAVSWHLEPERVARVYQRLGDQRAIQATVIDPAIEDGLKAVVAGYRAEQLITERAAVKQQLAALLTGRLAAHDLGFDAVDLLQVDFSDRFRQAVEAKQVAEQDAKRAEFEAAKARRLADARVFLAEGEARAQQLLQAGLTPEVLERQAIEKWNGRLPLVIGHDGLTSLDLRSLLKADARLNKRR